MVSNELISVKFASERDYKAHVWIVSPLSIRPIILLNGLLAGLDPCFFGFPRVPPIKVENLHLDMNLPGFKISYHLALLAVQGAR